jgi:hypothetical protein
MYTLDTRTRYTGRRRLVFDNNWYSDLTVRETGDFRHRSLKKEKKTRKITVVGREYHDPSSRVHVAVYLYAKSNDTTTVYAYWINF